MLKSGHIEEIQSTIIMMQLEVIVQILCHNAYMQEVKLWTIINCGWYYNNANSKSASWTGVEYLYKFLTTNKGIGPYGKEVEIEEIRKGDLAQLSFDGEKFSHSLLIIQEDQNHSINNTLVATHTFDSYGRNIASYNFIKIRYIHIEAVKTYWF